MARDAVLDLMTGRLLLDRKLRYCGKTHEMSHGSWVIGHGSWATGYGLWVTGLVVSGLWLKSNVTY
jgi:hypothetical protein